MEAGLAQMPIIDVDTHFTEPPDLWVSRAPSKLRDRVLRVVRNDQGKEQWVADRDVVFGPPGFCVIRPDASKAYGMWTLESFAELHPGASHARERLAFMDQNGLTLQIFYPNVLGFAGNQLMRIQDQELRRFCVTAYNDAVAQMHVDGDGRLFPQALLPFWDIDASVRELARCHDELHLTGVTLTDAPEGWGLPTLSDPYWDPLWSSAQERGLPINFHIGGGTNAGLVPWAGTSLQGLIAGFSSVGIMGNMRCLTYLIFSGLLDRYPRLKFVSVESGIGWLPFLLELLEYQFDENAIKSLKLRPREYFKRQIYASYWFESDARGPIEKLGEDNIMFETDFPHPTCLYPGIREHVEQTLGRLPERVQRKVLYETAQRVYNLPLPRSNGH
jgi:predicted TIM-barrel fold metal-dependent hydrolase